MTSIFVSYSSLDRSVADVIAKRLRAHGADVFIDYQKLQAGEDFLGRLGGAIEKADYFVLLVSPRSLDSKWVRAEISWAFTNDKTIVPVLLEPASYNGVFVLAALHHIDFTRWAVDGKVEAAMEQLIAAVQLPKQPMRPDSLPERVMVPPPDAGEAQQAQQAEQRSVNFAREDLSEMFFAAMEVKDENPEEALFLLQQVIETDANFMRGQAQDFVARESERLRPLRLSNLHQRAEAALQSGAWRAAERIANDMLAIEERNAEAQRILQLVAANTPCEPIYQQAQIAAERGRWKAMLPLLADIQETCPDYGDPDGLFMKAMAKGKTLEMPPPFAWSDIPSGQVTIEGRQHSVTRFKMATYPITNAQFQLFIDDPNGYRNDHWWTYSQAAQNWRAQNRQPHAEVKGGPTHPKVYVNWYEAMAYCWWLSTITGAAIRLPTEAEWQWAAAGNKGWSYPYGNSFDATKSNTSESGIGRTTPVDHYPAGASPFGVLDMSGNVWEWCFTQYDGSINVIDSDNSRVRRGGSFGYSRNSAVVSNRDDYSPNDRTDSIGFRVALSSPIS